MGHQAKKGGAPASLTLTELHMPFAMGIERDACLVEIRLALHFYRQHHRQDHWRVYNVAAGSA